MEGMGDCKPMRTDLATRFWAKVHKTERCWLWQGAKAWGYGKIYVEGHVIRAHRVAWEMTHGPIPEGLLVLHECDTPACVNPSHLRLGTQRENISDCRSRGRFRSQTERDSLGRYMPA